MHGHMYTIYIYIYIYIYKVYCYLHQLSNQHDLIPKFACTEGYFSSQKMVMVTHHKRNLDTFWV